MTGRGQYLNILGHGAQGGRHWLKTLGLLSLGCTALWAGGAATAEDRLAEAVAVFHRAYQSWDGEGLSAAATLFRKESQRQPASPRASYWQGVALFHQALHGQQGAGVEALRDEALTALRRAVDLDPRQAESHALIATLYGQKIQASFFRGLRYGPSLQRHFRLALAEDAGSPRVQYLVGVSEFYMAHRQKDFAEALSTLQKANALFDAEAATSAGPLDPRWGRASSLSFTGRTYERLGLFPQAAETFQRALALQPLDEEARTGLARVGPKK